MWRVELAFALALMLAAFALLIAPGYTGTEPARSELIGPTTFPRIALGGLIVLLALISVREILRRHKQAAAIEFDVLRTLFVVAWTLVYIWAISSVGFPIATFLFQIGFLFVIFQIRSLSRLVVVSVPFSIICTVLFTKVLQVPLPRGVVPFYWLNAIVY